MKFFSLGRKPDKVRKFKILFILKKKLPYVGPYGDGCVEQTRIPSSYGLINSAKLAAEALRREGHETKVVVVVDGNSIDKEVHDYRPDIVIIEALWVTPAKFAEVIPLHPGVKKWIVRIHSKPAFLSHEGIAFKWIRAYQHLRVIVAPNNLGFTNDLRDLFHYTPENTRFAYLPNLYPDHVIDVPNKPKHDIFLDVGCFGAIRPMKNQLEQAIAAMIFADQLGKVLWFHVNADRVEQGGAGALKNLQYLFKGTPHHLIECEWRNRDEFLLLVGAMDLHMQVSFSETFNIVTADAVATGVPVVVSSEVDWVPSRWVANTTNTDSILRAIDQAYFSNRASIVKANRKALKKYNVEAVSVWTKFLKS